MNALPLTDSMVRYDFAFSWSTPGRRAFPNDTVTVIGDLDGNRRGTIRATYRLLRATQAPWQARMILARLLATGQDSYVAHPATASVRSAA